MRWISKVVNLVRADNSLFLLYRETIVRCKLKLRWFNVLFVKDNTIISGIETELEQKRISNTLRLSWLWTRRQHSVSLYILSMILPDNVVRPCALNLISAFLLSSLGRYRCWSTDSYRGHHSLNGQCFCYPN